MRLQMNDSRNTLSEKARDFHVSARTRVQPSMQVRQSLLEDDDASGAAEVPQWKRALDIACILLALPGVLLLMLFIAVGIKLVSPGPVLFRQERVGHRRKRFMCLKFRTMKTGADTTAHQQHLQHLLHADMPMVKMDAAGDPRLIPFGEMLRATGLDELPQLFNILRGEMSLVGPRPCTAYELASYHPPHYARFDTLPGLTGLWQVRGKNKTTFTEMIKLDIYYAKNKSLQLDLRIMAETFSTLASQVGEALGKASSQWRKPVEAERSSQPFAE
jgi:lipopolysaccharide/colanic/teichoic acid biosynthesis glycosyltransferase